ncbi:PREDICTED: maltase 1-like [Ceratosolen solmsi marchali]|uniref:alpha-glucosidase n=1 Tax=Ceratosolen solmsi marchali TaxID=326594 RepID=A0AAJ6YLB7_9HYME|nr:PREDICTED: maltase 1-like [Ceratosolen solmsi marchali]
MLIWKLYYTFLFIIGLTVGEIKNKGWWKNEVFYQVFPRSFMDSNGDGIGDLNGIISKLDHFVDSGITAIWMSPIYSSPMIDSGYDITNFRDVDQIFGTIHDFEKLVQKAKKLGIKIIMDFVPNHTSIKHKWFVKSVNNIGKYKDYYIWHKGRENNTKPPNNWIGVFGGPAWTYNKKRNLWYYHQFDYRQPDLNYRNYKVEIEMKKILHFWLRKGIDGFRIDAVPNLFENDDLLDEPLSNLKGYVDGEYRYHDHIYTTHDSRDYEIVARWRKILDEWANYHNQEEKIVMTEVYTLSFKAVMKYYNYGSHVPFNFDFIISINETLNARQYKNVITRWIANLPSDKSANWVTSNHDTGRSASVDPIRPNIRLILSLILPGISCVYYGDEIGMENNFNITWEQTQDPQACRTDPKTYQKVSRDFSRTPFQWDDTMNAGFSKARKTWLPVHKNYKILNLKNQKFEPESHFKLFKTLVALKKSSETLKSGSLITDTLNNDKVLVVSRQSSNESIVFIVNFSDDVSQNVNLNKYLPGAVRATVIISSVGSNIRWGTSIKVPDVELPPSIMLLLTSITVEST